MKVFRDLFNSKFVLTGNRLAWIDYVRGICIILVCYRHCFDGIREVMPVNNYPILSIINICFYSFRMPLFFIISGLFVSRSLQKKGINDYIGGRFKIVFYPLIIWGSLQITLQLLFKDYVNAKPEPSDYINLIIYPRNPANNQQFWYLNALFFVGVFYAFFKVICKFNRLHQGILSLVLYAVAAYMNMNGKTFYIFPDIFHYYIYFYIGDLISDFVFRKDSETKLLSVKWLLPSAIAFIVSQAYFTVVNLQHKNEDYINSFAPVRLLLISLIGCGFMIQVGHWLQKTGFLKWLRVIGYHSLYIYLMHLIVIAGARVIMAHVLGIKNVPVILFFAVGLGVTIPIIIYNLCTRLHAWWLFSLKKPEAEIRHYAAMDAAV